MCNVPPNKKEMDAEELYHMADNLFEQAVEANTFWNVMKQFKTNIEKYKDEMDCSPAFYNFIYHSLAISVQLLLSKLYDRNKDSITIQSLVNGMRSFKSEHLSPKVKEHYERFGGKFQHRLKPIEECYFEKEVSEQKEICRIIKQEYIGTIVDLSLEEYVKLYQWKFRDLKKKDAIDNLISQRNKMVAHNDADINFDFDKLQKEHPFTHEDIDMLIEFALDCTQFVKGNISGIHTVPEYTNIDDWKATLNLVKIGRKYRDAYKKELLKELTHERK